MRFYCVYSALFFLYIILSWPGLADAFVYYLCLESNVLLCLFLLLEILLNLYLYTSKMCLGAVWK